MPSSSPVAATLVGLTAVLMWATLGLFTAASGEVPPFLMNALCFAFSGTLALIVVRLRSGSFKALRQPLAPWLVGVLGLFGFHFLYFTSLRNAPPVEANLINYLWPLLIVLFSGLLPGERLRWFHLAGAGLGLVGAALLVTKGKGFALEPEYALGYGAAILSALTWSSYSVISRRFGQVPTDAVAGFCLATAALSFLCHLALEKTIWPASPGQWGAILALGLLPVGAAFFTWDYGLKRGNIQVLGASAYLAPLLSTLLLIAFGYGAFTWPVIAACVLITVGALVAAKEMIFSR
ncbi:DMT family transporter [Amorphus sp. 3PC139-8]|uniref:aromatic amino acid exporter YddG n=1 Tax=Amorphus sp. 3PC139-8 TaxID=2735676 RepID=UPI00345CFE3F